MRVSLLILIDSSLIPGIVSRAQEFPLTELNLREVASSEQDVPAAGQAPVLNSQIHEKEERHRLFWIFPTYTVAFSKSPPPLTAGGKWQLFVRDKTDPFTIGLVAAGAGIAQANNDFSGYGQGASGYGKRFGSGLADETAGGFFGTVADHGNDFRPSNVEELR